MSEDVTVTPETVTTDSAETTVVGEPTPVEKVSDMDAVLDAVKELTVVVGELAKKLNTHMTAGKF